MRYELDPTCVLKFYISRLPQDRQNMGYDLDPTCVSKPHISRFPQNMQHGLDPTCVIENFKLHTYLRELTLGRHHL